MSPDVLAIKRGNEGGLVGGAKKPRGEAVTLRFLLQSKVSKFVLPYFLDDKTDNVFINILS